MKAKRCKRLLSLAMVAAMFLSMETGVFAEDVSASDTSVAKVVSQSDVVEKVSGEETTSDETTTKKNPNEKTQFDLSSVESTRDMPYAVTGSKDSMVQSNTAKRSTVTTKKYNSSRSIIEAETSGKCGDNINWSFDTATGKLTLSGTGAMYDYDMDNSKDPGWRSYAEMIQSVVIGNGITSIGDEAFVFCSSLETVSIPETVTSIGRIAFANCINLRSAKLPNQLRTIKKSAFDNCIVLSNIVLPETLESIGGWAFEFCYEITSIHIPKNVKSIGEYAFEKCSISNITVDSGNAFFSTVDNVLFNKDKTALIYYPCGKKLSSYTIPNTVSEICDGAFGGISSLTSVTIPTSVKKIGVWAFAECENLQSAKIPNSVMEISYRAFFRCINLCDSNIPNSLSTISLGLFEECKHMTAFTIPSTVKTIERYAFINTGIKEINIPGSVERIGEQSFYGCKLLQKITLHTGLKSIGDSCFMYTAANKIYVPTSVTSIGTYAFSWNCTLYGESGSYVETYVNDANFSDYEFIAGNCPDIPFEDDPQTTSGTFPSGQTWSFDANTKIFTVTGTGTVKMYDFDVEYDDETEQDIYTGDYDKYNEILMISNYSKKLVIGEGIEDAVALLSGLFFNNVEVISLPSTLLPEDEESDDVGEEDYDEDEEYTERSVYYYGLTGSYKENLREIIVASGNKSLKSVDGVLFNYDKTILIAYPPKKSLTKYCIPNTVKTVNDWAFFNCGNLRNIIIPNGVEKIGKSAFFNCWFLQTIVIPDSVTEMGDAAFMRCAAMDNVVIGNGVTELKGTFAQCDELTYVTLPDSLTTIDVGSYSTFEGGYDVGTFEGCTSLKRLYIPKSVEHISDDWGWEDSFSENYGNCTSFEGFIVDKDNPVYYSKDGVLFNKQTKTLLFYPIAKKDSSYTISNDVLAIDSAFSWWDRDNPLFNVNLKSLIIPKTVTTLGNYVFVGLSNLEDIYYEGTQQQWSNLVSSNYDDENDLLPNDNVTIHYNYVPTALSITSHPANVTAKVNDNVSFTVRAQGDGLTYQWYYKKAGQSAWNKWGTRTTATTTATANATWNGMQVYCKVTDQCGNSVDSNPATITIKQELKITAQPTDKTIKLGESLTLSVKAEGIGLTYQWYYKKSGATTWSKWNGRTHASETVTPNATWNGIQLYCTVKDSSGNSLDSSIAKITVTQDLKITTQPTNKTIKKGESVTLSLKAEGTGLTYQWYYKKAGATSFSTWNGRTHASETVTPNTTWNGIQLYCVVKDSSGKKVQSNTIKVLFSDVVTIVTQPKNVTAKTGENVTFKFVAEGVGLTYQWYYKKAGATAWSKWNGRTTASTTATSNASWDGMQVYCVVKNSSGSTLNSNIAKITLSDVLAITQQPSNVTTQAGQNVTFTVKAKGVGLKYQWQYKKSGQASWSNWGARTTASTTATSNATWNGMQVRCIVTDSARNKITSNAATITIK